MKTNNEFESYYYNQLNDSFQSNGYPDEDGVYYKESDYAELQRNLILYKSGNREATTYIIKVFHPFITKYTRFIVNGDLPYSTYINKSGQPYRKVSQTISSFVSLFNEKDETLDRKKQFSVTCLKIKKLFSKYEYFDIYNELVLALLNMANKYKVITDENDPHYKKNGTFHMYVSKCFHWEAHRFLKKLIADPLAHFEMLNFHDSFDDFDADGITENDLVLVDTEFASHLDKLVDQWDRQERIRQSKKLTLREDSDIDIYSDDVLNFNWVNGITCSEAFQVLTPYERELLIYTFIEKKSSQEISEIYGCHRATINQHRKRAIEKVKTKVRQLQQSS